MGGNGRLLRGEVPWRELHHVVVPHCDKQLYKGEIWIHGSDMWNFIIIRMLTVVLEGSSGAWTWVLVKFQLSELFPRISDGTETNRFPRLLLEKHGWRAKWNKTPQQGRSVKLESTDLDLNFPRVWRLLDPNSSFAPSQNVRLPLASSPPWILPKCRSEAGTLSEVSFFCCKWTLQPKSLKAGSSPTIGMWLRLASVKCERSQAVPCWGPAGSLACLQQAQSHPVSEAAEEDPGDVVVGVCTKACSPGIFSPPKYACLILRGIGSKADLFPGCGSGYTVLFTHTGVGTFLSRWFMSIQDFFQQI